VFWKTPWPWTRSEVPEVADTEIVPPRLARSCWPQVTSRHGADPCWPQVTSRHGADPCWPQVTSRHGADPRAPASTWVHPAPPGGGTCAASRQRPLPATGRWRPSLLFETFGTPGLRRSAHLNHERTAAVVVRFRRRHPTPQRRPCRSATAVVPHSLSPPSRSLRAPQSCLSCPLPVLRRHQRGRCGAVVRGGCRARRRE